MERFRLELRSVKNNFRLKTLLVLLPSQSSEPRCGMNWTVPSGNEAGASQFCRFWLQTSNEANRDTEKPDVASRFQGNETWSNGGSHVLFSARCKYVHLNRAWHKQS